MSKYLKNYVIPFSGLKIGKHEFEFECGKKFFESFDKSEINDATISAKIVVDKQVTLMTLHVELEGSIKTTCDRCGGELVIHEKNTNKLFVKYGNEPEDSSDDIVYISEKDSEIDVSRHIYEFSHLLVPLKKTHPEGACDEEMLKLIATYSPKNNKGDSGTDPRWDALKNIK